MQCSICTAFKSEIGREDETEAVATLKQRARMIGPLADCSTEDVLENVILVSRKRRAHIATELRVHQDDVHAAEPDQLPGVRQTASA